MSPFRPINRDVDFLLLPSGLECLPGGHLARYVGEVVEGLDLRALVRACAGRGCQPYRPATSVPQVIYGYATDRLVRVGSRRSHCPLWVVYGHCPPPVSVRCLVLSGRSLGRPRSPPSAERRLAIAAHSVASGLSTPRREQCAHQRKCRSRRRGRVQNERDGAARFPLMTPGVSGIPDCSIY
jgi:hypothetical protein